MTDGQWMATPWYRNLFSHVPKTSDPTTRTTAEAGDADAQFALGVQYSSGAGPDFVQAAEWYRKAADQNHTLAQFNLGIMFSKGQGVTHDDATAVMWITRSAEGGDAGAQFNLGTRHHRASLNKLQPGASESRIEAFKWIHLATAQGYNDSNGSGSMITMRMTPEEFTEAKRRVASFRTTNSSESAS
jgi:TPR repeat protein